MTKIRVKKIDGPILDIFGIVIISFSIKNEQKKSRFLKKTFLLSDISINIALEVLFITLSNVKIEFFDPNLYLKNYIVTKAFPKTKQVQLIVKKKFVAIALNLKDEAFVVYIVSICQNLDLHPSQKL